MQNSFQGQYGCLSICIFLLLALYKIHFESFEYLIKGFISNTDNGTKTDFGYPANQIFNNINFQSCGNEYYPVCGSDGLVYQNECIFSVFKRLHPELTAIAVGKECDYLQKQLTVVKSSNNEVDNNLGNYIISKNKFASPNIYEFENILLEGKLRPYQRKDISLENILSGYINNLMNSAIGRHRLVNDQAFSGSTADSGLQNGYPICNFNCKQSGDPVCGSNGVTYANQCLLMKAACLLPSEVPSPWPVHRGPCNFENRYNTAIVPYGQILPVNYPALQYEKAYATTINDLPIINNVPSYVNFSSASNYQVELNNIFPKSNKTASTNKPNIANAGNYSFHIESRVPFGSSKVCNTACPMNGPAVCGSDGLTYTNECELHAYECLSNKIVTIEHFGRCKNNKSPHEKNLTYTQNLSILDADRREKQFTTPTFVAVEWEVLWDNRWVPANGFDDKSKLEMDDGSFPRNDDMHVLEKDFGIGVTTLVENHTTNEGTTQTFLRDPVKLRLNVSERNWAENMVVERTRNNGLIKSCISIGAVNFTEFSNDNTNSESVKENKMHKDGKQLGYEIPIELNRWITEAFNTPSVSVSDFQDNGCSYSGQVDNTSNLITDGR